MVGIQQGREGLEWFLGIYLVLRHQAKSKALFMKTIL